jgi:hypothetical protein
VTRIAVDPARRVGDLDRKVFGGFVEHLGRCIYGGIYDEGSPLSDQRGFRRDVLGLLRELRVAVLRWPGGNFVSNYHWADGIGPKDARPRRPELAWGGEESNRFGTDEFLAYCAELGTEPYICLNMGTGSLEEALAWVEYCNGTGATARARQRAGNGHEAPYGVRYWGLGNEMYGAWQVGALSADEYVREASRWARAIKMLDPDAVLVSCGMNGWSDWDRVVIDGMAHLVGLHSLHIYTGSDDYWTNVLQPHQAERAIRCARALIERAAYVKKIARPPRIAYDEWNVWFRTDDRSRASPRKTETAGAPCPMSRECAWRKGRRTPKARRSPSRSRPGRSPSSRRRRPARNASRTGNRRAGKLAGRPGVDAGAEGASVPIGGTAASGTPTKSERLPDLWLTHCPKQPSRRWTTRSRSCPGRWRARPGWISRWSIRPASPRTCSGSG